MQRAVKTRICSFRLLLMYICGSRTNTNFLFIPVKVKVKCTLVQALRLCTGRTAHRRSRGIALSFLDHGTRRWWRISVTPRPLFAPGKDPVPIVQEAGWVPGPVCTGAENLTSMGIRSPDRPARSQSLYRLHLFSDATSKMYPSATVLSWKGK